MTATLLTRPDTAPKGVGASPGLAADYRARAMRAYDLADEAEAPGVIDIYVRIAAKWLMMAEQAELAALSPSPAGAGLQSMSPAAASSSR